MKINYNKEDVQKEMRKEVKRLLRVKGCLNERIIEPLAHEIMGLARVHFKET